MVKRPINEPESHLKLTVMNTGNLNKGTELLITPSGLADSLKAEEKGPNVYFGCKKRLNGRIVNDFVIPITDQEVGEQHRGQHFVVYYQEDV